VVDGYAAVGWLQIAVGGTFVLGALLQRTELGQLLLGVDRDERRVRIEWMAYQVAFLVTLVVGVLVMLFGSALTGSAGAALVVGTGFGAYLVGLVLASRTT
jgi:hypothetical protein